MEIFDQPNTGTGQHCLPIECAPHVDLDLTDQQARILLAIKTKTEQLRKKLREDPLWGSPVYLPPRGFKPRQATSEPLLCDQLPWPALLTLENCAEESAALAQCTETELLSYAIQISPYEHVVVLIQHLSHREGVQKAARLLSPYVQTLRHKEARIKDGARKGGEKSAQTRRKQSKAPAPEVLKHEAEKLLGSHHSKRDIAGILANRYGVEATTIRRKLQLAELSLNVHSTPQRDSKVQPQDPQNQTQPIDAKRIKV